MSAAVPLQTFDLVVLGFKILKRDPETGVRRKETQRLVKNALLGCLPYYPAAPLRLEWTTHSYKHCSYAIIRLYTKDNLLDIHSWLLDLELHANNIEFYLPLCLKSQVPVKSNFDEHTAQYLHDIVTLRCLRQPTWVRQLCGQHPFCDAPFPDYDLHNDRFGKEDLTDDQRQFEWRQSVA